MSLTLVLVVLLNIASPFQMVDFPGDVPVDKDAWVLIVDILKHDSDFVGDLNFDENELEKVSRELAQKGNVPADHITFIGWQNATLERFRDSIFAISRRMNNRSRLLLIVRSHILLAPGASRELFLVPKNAKEDDIFSLISTDIMNEWLSLIPGSKTVILDCYSEEPDLNVFYANRRTFGSSSIVSINHVPSDGKDIFIAGLSAAIEDEELDSNLDRTVSVLELYESIARNTEQYGILAPIGDPVELVITLPSAIFVKSTPPEADVILNGQMIGQTPCAIVGPRPGLHELRIDKALYRIPESQMVRVTQPRGESQTIEFELTPITISGKVSYADGVMLPETYVVIRGTDYIQKVDESGNFLFDKWEHGIPKPGKYIIAGEHSDTHLAIKEINLSGNTDIRVDLVMVHQPWDLISKLRYERGDELGSAEALEQWARNLGKPIELIPKIEMGHAKVMLGYFANEADESPQDMVYQIMAAHLSDMVGRLDLSKKYWRNVKLLAAKGTPEREMASKRLGELYKTRNVVITIVGILLVLVLASGAYMIFGKKVRNANKP